MNSAGMPWPPPRAKPRPLGHGWRHDPEDPTGWWRLAGFVLVVVAELLTAAGVALGVLAWLGVI